MKKILFILVLALPLSIQAQSDERQIQSKMQSITALDIETLRYSHAKLLVTLDNFLFISIQQDSIMSEQKNTIDLSRQRIDILTETIKNLESTIKSLNIVVAKQVEEIRDLKTKKK